MTAAKPLRQPMFSRAILRTALIDAVRKLQPVHQLKNPVMFVVYVGSLLTTLLFGALTTFSLANDVAKYFAIIPAAFAGTYPMLDVLNVMRLASPVSAILSAVIFNALIIVVLIPLALKGVRYRPIGATALLRHNLLVYGLGGLLAPFIGIKLVDLVLSGLGMA